MLRRSFLSALAATALLAACGDSGTGPDDTDIVGSYTLQTINGNAVPWRLALGNDWFEITSGSGNINADGTFRLTYDWRASVSGQVDGDSEDLVGTYTRNGNAITFRDPSDGSTVATGTISGRQLTVTYEGDVLVFVRN
jgi:hypothetical protein